MTQRIHKDDTVKIIAGANKGTTGKDIQVPVDLSKLALVVDEKSGQTSRVGYSTKDGAKVRVARQLNNKEIK